MAYGILIVDRFRWVFCQLESIRQCIQLKALRKTLSDLPKTLDETYNRILRDLVSAQQLENAVKVLQWLCFSHRPMRLTEIVEILAIETGDQGGFDPEERLPDPMDIMVVCSSLISFNQRESDKHFDINFVPMIGRSEDADMIQLQLAHFSVKEFLLSDRCAFSSHFRSQICHSVVAESCLRYLLHVFQEAPITKELVMRNPLTLYAAAQWWRHLQAISGRIDEIILDLTSRLLTEENGFLLSWVWLYDMDRPWRTLDPRRKAEDVAQPIYYAAQIGVPVVVGKILGRNTNANSRGGFYGNALEAASYFGHERVVQMLLDAGANVQAKGGFYGSALAAASSGGHERIVQMLLDAGANVGYGYALQAASYYGHERIVQILLVTPLRMPRLKKEGRMAVP